MITVAGVFNAVGTPAILPDPLTFSFNVNAGGSCRSLPPEPRDRGS